MQKDIKISKFHPIRKCLSRYCSTSATPLVKCPCRLFALCALRSALCVKLILLVLVTMAMTRCGGPIVTVRDLSEDEQPAVAGDLASTRADLPIEELKLSEELEGVKKVDVHEYLRMQPEKGDSFSYFKLGPEDRIRVDFFAARNFPVKGRFCLMDTSPCLWWDESKRPASPQTSWPC